MSAEHDPSPRPAEDPDGSAVPAPPDDAINILIVDDEPANLVVLETVLDDPSYRLVRAETANEALLALMREEFALLILDVRMPVMTGFELAQMVKERKRTAGVPIIFLTAYYDKDQHVLEGYGTGAVDYLNKPVNAAVLRSKVAVFADLHRKNREILTANHALRSEVSERRRAEEQLRQLNETLERRVVDRTEELRRADHQLRSLMRSITDGLLTLDHDWRFSYSNEEGAQLLGKTPDELMRRSIWELFPAMRETEFHEGLHRAVSGRQTVSFEAFYPEPLNRWFRCHCYPSDEGLSIYFHDVTDRRNVDSRREQLLEAEQAARTESERVARSKDQFLASLSHELRTPLAAMLGWAAILKRPGNDAATLRRGIEAIERNAQAQSRLVADLLETSRFVSGKLRMNVARVDLNSIAAAAADTARPAAQSKGVTMHLVPSALEPVIMGDAGRLEQVVANLLTNALKFTPSGGTITLTTTRHATVAELAVSDTGQGISAEFMPHLFERFSQADGSAARLHGGLGLGLSIAKHLVGLHDGTITAKSDGPDQGSTFVVSLPLAGEGGKAEPPGAPRDTRSPVGQPDLRGVAVLLVDDHPDVLEVQSRMLAEFGAVVTTAQSGDEALRCLGTGAFRVLLSDLGMPGMDGYGLIEHIRQVLGIDSQRLPAVAITAYVRPGDWDRALLAGYQVCIQKPVSPDSLVRALLEVLEGLPVKTNPSKLPAGSAGLLPRAARADRPLRALFVEDNADLRELIGSILEEEGLDVFACASGEEAESAFQDNPFDLVVTDVSLPGMSGVQLAKRLLATSPSTWMVFSTGYPMGDRLEDFGSHVRYLPKPFETEELQALLDEVRAAVHAGSD